MSKTNWQRYLPVSILGFTMLYFFSDLNPILPNADSKHLFFVPPRSLSYFTFGHRNTTADALWIRVIQDMHQCTYHASKDEKSPSVPLRVSELGAERIERAPSKCHLGWVYHMLEAITDLSPRFRLPYLSGGTALSILVDDREGAARIYEKGLKIYPNDSQLAYRAAYHFLFEVGDARRGVELLEQAGRLGAPQWVFSLAAKIRTKLGQALAARQMLVEAIEEAPEGPFAERLRERLKEVEAQIEANK